MLQIPAENMKTKSCKRVRRPERSKTLKKSNPAGPLVPNVKGNGKKIKTKRGKNRISNSVRGKRKSWSVRQKYLQDFLFPRKCWCCHSKLVKFDRDHLIQHSLQWKATAALGVAPVDNRSIIAPACVKCNRSQQCAKLGWRAAVREAAKLAAEKHPKFAAEISRDFKAFTGWSTPIASTKPMSAIKAVRSIVKSNRGAAKKLSF